MGQPRPLLPPRAGRTEAFLSGQVPQSGPAHVGGRSSPTRREALPGVFSGQMAALGQPVLMGYLGVGGTPVGFGSIASGIPSEEGGLGLKQLPVLLLWPGIPETFC